MRNGFTTGTCAACAAKACAIFLTTGEVPDYVSVRNLDGKTFTLQVFKEGKFFGALKDSGDDRSDITNGIKILAHVGILDDDDGKVIFVAGEGVGVVTLPGLKLEVGEPAINPVPRKMIELALREVISRKSLCVTISIPDGEKLAHKTFNPRLGIEGGLSILGTSGIVKPMNEQALLDSLTLELSMISALGFCELYIAFGNESEKILRCIFHVEGRNVIQCGNYIGHVLDEAARLEFERVILCGYPGKLLKVACGNFNTHNRISDGRLEALCTHLAIAGADCDVVGRVFRSNTTNEAVSIVNSEGFSRVWNDIAWNTASKCFERVREKLSVDVIFIDTAGKVLGVGVRCAVG